MLICAQYIVPITHEPIHAGAVLVRDGVIKDLGSSEMLKLRYPDEETVDYGTAVVIPGLIDLHTHLENSVMRGIVTDQPYIQWIQSVRAVGSKLDAHDWHSSSVLGGLEALSAGITFVADVSSTGASCSTIQKLGLRGIVYREVGAMDKRRVEDAMRMARNDIVRWSETVDSDRIKIGITPRETYDCHPAVFTESARIAREENIPLAVYVAESREEYDFIRYGSSSLSVDRMADKRGFVEVPPWLPTGSSPVRYVVNWGGFEADNVMAVHCVHVDSDDIKFLKNYDVAVAVCPRCDAQLSMGVSPVLEFLRAGLRVGLGSGYTVSTDSSDAIQEMRVGMLLNRAVNPGTFISAETMLRMATIDSARAVRMDDKIGSLEVGKYADLAVVDLSDSRQAPTDDPVTALVNTCSADDVLRTMVGG
ncbi:MAG: amidohydrolase family protein, partial [Eggerthellaceae bacterium]|nr:amidohydrolase family protein [Eggerthellaceae bacterium]